MSEKYIKALIAIITIAIVFSGGININADSGESNNKTAENAIIDQYHMDITLSEADKTIIGTQNVLYVNKESVPLNEVYFHVYANAFVKKDTAPVPEIYREEAYRDGFLPGKIEFSSVYILRDNEKESLVYQIMGEDKTLMKIVLPKQLMPGENISIEMKYIIQIPKLRSRLGYGKDSFNLGNWYPIAAVYDSTGWNLEKYDSIGDPFYSDVSNYTVVIRAPESYVIAASGTIVSESLDSGNKIWSIKADNMRDFAFTANLGYEYMEAQAGKTAVRSYYASGHEESGKTALHYAKDMIETLNKLIGEYPYESFSVVETEIGGGMEYPGLVFIGDDYYDGRGKYDSSFLYMAVTHETAHQWWYGVVGNDQFDEAWLDEGFATYTEAIYDENRPGHNTGRRYFNYVILDRVIDSKTGTVIPNKVLRPVNQFKEFGDYGNAVYLKGAYVLDEISRMVGNDVFFDILRTYYETYKYRIASTEDFIRICEAVSGKSLSETITKLLN